MQIALEAIKKLEDLGFPCSNLLNCGGPKIYHLEQYAEKLKQLGFSCSNLLTPQENV